MVRTVLDFFKSPSVRVRDLAAMLLALFLVAMDRYGETLLDSENGTGFHGLTSHFD